MWDPAIVLRTADTFVESGEWRGYEGVLQFTSEQMQAFEQMWDRARGVHRFRRRPGSAGSLRRAGAAHRDRGSVLLRTRHHDPERKDRARGRLREQGASPRSRGAAGVGVVNFVKPF